MIPAEREVGKTGEETFVVPVAEIAKALRIEGTIMDIWTDAYTDKVHFVLESHRITATG